MPKFTIPVSWTMIADVEIEADTLEEAIEIVEEEAELPKDGEYCDSSFEVNHEVAIELNKPDTPAFLIEPNKETT